MNFKLDVIYLLNRYGEDLKILHKIIDDYSQPQKNWNESSDTWSDLLIIQQTLSMLQAIIDDEQKFCPQVTTFSKGIIKPIRDNYSKGLAKEFFTHTFKKHFMEICSRFLKDNVEIHNKMHEFYVKLFQEHFVIYKAKINGELAIKFPTKIWRDFFIKELGDKIVSQFDDEDSKHKCYAKYNVCPRFWIFANDDKVLYIQAYKATNGKLAVMCPTQVVCDNFIRLLRHLPKEEITMYKNSQRRIYFNDKGLHTTGYTFSVTAPVEISSLPSAAILDVRHVARMVGQAIRTSNHFFGKLPKELNAKIVSSMINADVLPKETVMAMAEKYFKKPTI